MTIREEIESILMKPIYSDKAIDEILLVFEKWIDENINLNGKEEPSPYKTGYYSALHKLKEELNDKK